MTRLLDLFAGAGETWEGYTLADFAAIHASPPCQAFTSLRALNLHRWGKVRDHPDHIATVRELCLATGSPYVIENVPGAPLHVPVRLCGSMFGLGVRRHRLFESRVWDLRHPPCRHRGHEFVGVYGDRPLQVGVNSRDGYIRRTKARTLDEGRDAMGIDWMVWRELTQAIPPAYTQWIGERLREAIGAAA